MDFVSGSAAGVTQSARLAGLYFQTRAEGFRAFLREVVDDSEAACAAAKSLEVVFDLVPPGAPFDEEVLRHVEEYCAHIKDAHLREKLSNHVCAYDFMGGASFWYEALSIFVDHYSARWPGLSLQFEAGLAAMAPVGRTHVKDDHVISAVQQLVSYDIGGLPPAGVADHLVYGRWLARRLFADGMADAYAEFHQAAGLPEQDLGDIIFSRFEHSRGQCFCFRREPACTEPLCTLMRTVWEHTGHAVRVDPGKYRGALQSLKGFMGQSYALRNPDAAVRMLEALMDPRWGNDPVGAILVGAASLDGPSFERFAAAVAGAIARPATRATDLPQSSFQLGVMAPGGTVFYHVAWGIRVATDLARVPHHAVKEVLDLIVAAPGSRPFLQANGRRVEALAFKRFMTSAPSEDAYTFIVPPGAWSDLRIPVARVKTPHAGVLVSVRTSAGLRGEGSVQLRTPSHTFAVEGVRAVPGMSGLPAELDDGSIVGVLVGVGLEGEAVFVAVRDDTAFARVARMCGRRWKKPPPGSLLSSAERADYEAKQAVFEDLFGRDVFAEANDFLVDVYGGVHMARAYDEDGNQIDGVIMDDSQAMAAYGGARGAADALEDWRDEDPEERAREIRELVDAGFLEEPDEDDAPDDDAESLDQGYVPWDRPGAGLQEQLAAVSTVASKVLGVRRFTSGDPDDEIDEFLASIPGTKPRSASPAPPPASSASVASSASGGSGSGRARTPTLNQRLAFGQGTIQPPKSKNPLSGLGSDEIQALRSRALHSWSDELEEELTAKAAQLEALMAEVSKLRQRKNDAKTLLSLASKASSTGDPRGFAEVRDSFSALQRRAEELRSQGAQAPLPTATEEEMMKFSGQPHLLQLRLMKRYVAELAKYAEAIKAEKARLERLRRTEENAKKQTDASLLVSAVLQRLDDAALEAHGKPLSPPSSTEGARGRGAASLPRPGGLGESAQ